MTLQGGRYVGTIPSQAPFASVQWYVSAVDNVGNESRSAAGSFSVGIPVWMYAAVLGLLAVASALVVLRRRSRRTPPPPPPPPPSTASGEPRAV